MPMSSNLFARILITAFVLAGGASAQTSPASQPPVDSGVTALATPLNVSNDPIAHYRLYEAAISRGDLSAASAAAMMAWQTGERVWNGRNPNLPGLAFNAAWSLGLVNRIHEAQAPAARAITLAGEFPNSVNVNEASFLLAYANMMVSKSKRDLAAFNIASRAIDNGTWSDLLLTRAYLQGAEIGLQIEMPRVARDLVDRGLAEVTRIAPGNNAMRTNLYVLRTQSSLQLRQYSQAVSEIMEARRSYGVPKSERDLDWSSLAAWEAASRAVWTSVKGPRIPLGSRISQPGDLPEWPEEELTALSANPPECKDFDIDRKGRAGPQGIAFPQRELRDNFVGGAFVRARLDSEGKVISADVLSALPRPAFGVAAQQGIINWQYDVPAGTPPQCRVVDISVMYAFAN